jgi:molybdopterin synthase catalytic subunit
MALRPGRVQQIFKREERGIDRSNEPFTIEKLFRRPGLVAVQRTAFESGYTSHLREIYPQWGIAVSTCLDEALPVKHPRLRFDHYVDLVKVWEDQDCIYVEDMYVDVLIYERSYYHVIDLEEFGEAVYTRQMSSAEAKRVLENTQKFVDSMKRSRLSYHIWKHKYGVNRRIP